MKPSHLYILISGAVVFCLVACTVVVIAASFMFQADRPKAVARDAAKPLDERAEVEPESAPAKPALMPLPPPEDTSPVSKIESVYSKSTRSLMPVLVAFRDTIALEGYEQIVKAQAVFAAMVNSSPLPTTAEDSAIAAEVQKVSRAARAFVNWYSVARSLGTINQSKASQENLQRKTDETLAEIDRARARMTEILSKVLVAK